MNENPHGIIDPPIDELLQRVDNKYQLVIFASRRARQINDYYADLHDGNLFGNVGPLVDSSIDDKPLSIALHEINEQKLLMKDAPSGVLPELPADDELIFDDDLGDADLLGAEQEAAAEDGEAAASGEEPAAEA